MPSRSDRFIRADVRFRRRDDGRLDLYLVNAGETQVVASRQIEMLEKCRQCRTLEEHVSAIVDNAGTDLACGSPEAVETVLGELIDRELLRRVPPRLPGSRSHFPTTHAVGSARRMAIELPTAGRAAAVARLVRSIHASTDRASFDRVVVRLDSNDDADRRALERELALPSDRATTGTNAPPGPAESDRENCVVVRDRIEREAYVESLCNELELDSSEREAVRFGLMPERRDGVTTVGSTRSVQLLDGAGREAVLSIDDDIVCRGVRFGPNDHAAIAGANGGVVLRYASDRERLLQSLDLVDIDPIAETEGVIGRSLDELPPAIALDWSSVNSHLLARIEAHRPTIDAVLFGTIGDSGFGTGRVLLSDAFAYENELGEITAAPPPAALTSREICRYTPRTLITSSPFCMSTAIALDTRRLLPPFFPFGRGQDGLFGQMLTYLFDDSLIAHLPVSLLHDPVDSDRRQVAEIPTCMELSITRVAGIILGYYTRDEASRSRVDRLRGFGQWLVDLTDLDSKRFDEALREMISTAMQRYADRVRARLERLPPDAALDATAIAALLSDLDRLGSVGDLPPVQEYGDERPDALAELIRHDLGYFGRFLTLWPDLVEAARTIEA